MGSFVPRLSPRVDHLGKDTRIRVTPCIGFSLIPDHSVDDHSSERIDHRIEQIRMVRRILHSHARVTRTENLWRGPEFDGCARVTAGHQSDGTIVQSHVDHSTEQPTHCRHVSPRRSPDTRWRRYRPIQFHGQDLLDRHRGFIRRSSEQSDARILSCIVDLLTLVEDHSHRHLHIRLA